jgi:hypothetical protein
MLKAKLQTLIITKNIIINNDGWYPPKDILREALDYKKR